MSRPKRPSRLAWFALDVDAFIDDTRMIELTAKQRSAWALMLIKSFRTGGYMATGAGNIAENTGLSQKEAKELVEYLVEQKLLIKTGITATGYSPRMIKEVKLAQESYDRFSKMGASSAEKHGTANLKLVK